MRQKWRIYGLSDSLMYENSWGGSGCSRPWSTGGTGRPWKFVSRAQAERLQQDWYYRHAHFEPITEEQVVMTFGEQNPTIVLELLRWLGPGAELLEPHAWRNGW